MRHRLKVAISMTALVLIVTGCSAAQDPRLRWPGTGSYGAGLPNTMADTSYSFGGTILCLASPGAVVVTEVTVVDPVGGLRVVDFGVRENPHLAGGPGLGAIQQSLDEAGFERRTPATVDGVCDDGPGEAKRFEGSVELGLELQKPAQETASGKGFDVSYHAEDNTKVQVLRVPFSATLCSPADTVGQGC